jgi:hypothetical protein
MAGETNLNTLLKTLTGTLQPDVHVFATFSSDVPDGLSPLMVFQEAEGTTLILLKSEADAHALSYEFPARMITLNVHSSLEAVGFMAVIATELAKEGMGVNPVAGFFHDHIFIPDGREGDALRVIAQIAKDAQGS